MDPETPVEAPPQEGKRKDTSGCNQAVPQERETAKDVTMTASGVSAMSATASKGSRAPDGGRKFNVSIEVQEMNRKLSEKGGEPLVQLQQAVDAPIWPAVLSVYLHMTAISLAMPFYAELALLSPYASGEYIGEELEDTEVTKRAQTVLSAVLVMNALFELLSSGTLGVLCDRVGRWQVAVMTQIGQFIDFGTAAFCAAGSVKIHNTALALIFARSLAGVCGNMKVPVLAYVADVSSAEASPRNYGLIGATQSLALVTGPMIAGITLHISDSVRYCLAIAALLSLVNITLVLCRWPRTKASVENAAPWRDANPWYLVQVLRRTKPLMIYGLMNYVDAFALYMIFASMPLFTRERYDWTSRNLVVMFLIIGFGAPLQVILWTRVMVKYTGEVFVLKLGYIASFLAYFLWFIVGMQNVGFFMYFVLGFFTLGLVSNAMQTGMAVREVHRDDLGRFSGAYSVLETLGKVLAPVVAAVVLNNTIDGPLPSAVFLAASVALLPGVICAFAVARLVQVCDVSAGKDVTPGADTVGKDGKLDSE